MYNFDKKISSMVEDFQFLGIIKEPLNESSVEQKTIVEEKKASIESAEKRVMSESMRQKIRARLLEAKQKRKLILSEEKKAEFKKRIEEKIANARKKRVMESLKNKRPLENRAKIQESLDNIKKISGQLAFPRKIVEAALRLKSIAERGLVKADKILENEVVINKNDKTQNDLIGKKIPSKYNELLKQDTAKEGNPEKAKDDGITDPAKMPTDIPDTTGKQAGEMAYKQDKKEVNLMGENEEADGEKEIDKLDSEKHTSLEDEIDATLAALLSDNENNVKSDVIKDDDKEEKASEESKENSKEADELQKKIKEQKEIFAKAVKESSDLLSKIRTFAISPKDAEKMLADVAKYLGGAVEEMPVLKEKAEVLKKKK